MSQKEITIAGLLLNVTVPYAEGHVLTAAEAKQLNQVRAENVRNNTAAAVKKLASEDGTYTPEAVASAAALVAQYDSEYDFTISSGGTKRVTDPLEKECQSIARAHITALIKKSGKAVKDFPKDKLEAKVEELAGNPDVIKMAKARLREREKLAEAVTLDLGASPESEAA